MRSSFILLIFLSFSATSQAQVLSNVSPSVKSPRAIERRFFLASNEARWKGEADPDRTFNWHSKPFRTMQDMRNGEFRIASYVEDGLTPGYVLEGFGPFDERLTNEEKATAWPGADWIAPAGSTFEWAHSNWRQSRETRRSTG